MASAWSEQGTVGIWSLDQCLQKVDQPGVNTEKDQREAASPLFNFKGHQTEGFAMNWSPTMPGVLATGTHLRKYHCKFAFFLQLKWQFSRGHDKGIFKNIIRKLGHSSETL